MVTKVNLKVFSFTRGSTGCQAETTSQKPTTKCSNPNRATITLNNFDLSKNVIVADIAKLLANNNLSRNQPGTAPGCMSEPNDLDCTGIFKNLGISSGNQTQSQTFFSVK
ncbi:hypothetical protein NIES4071_15080 [Calothrix sp. NIES-4071]|nr:hypothetical protein NIES4071_15080 [Calothrix sp. NIES-4071]BAZ55845.1 hypothetical protein NIES4105_15030 [Calothrix sp. NIES-4105]